MHRTCGAPRQGTEIDELAALQDQTPDKKIRTLKCRLFFRSSELALEGNPRGEVQFVGDNKVVPPAATKG